MSLLGKTIQLSGITQKGKNRIRDNGSNWIVLAETDKIIFSSEPGPWLFIAPEGKNQDHKSCRWIRTENDNDFRF